MGGWKNLKTMQLYIRKAGVNTQGITGDLDLNDYQSEYVPNASSLEELQEIEEDDREKGPRRMSFPLISKNQVGLRKLCSFVFLELSLCRSFSIFCRL
jgi:hypothetical protein